MRESEKPTPDGGANGRATERSVSGRAVVVAAAVVIVALVAGAAMFGPGLREQVRQETRPRTLREPIASGRVGGRVWEAVARFDGTANCVELRFANQTLDRACAGKDMSEPLQEVGSTALTSDGARVVYGVAAEAVASVRLQAADGAPLSAPVAAGDLGFPVGFWAASLPAGGAVTVTALDASGAQLATRRLPAVQG